MLSARVWIVNKSGRGRRKCAQIIDISFAISLCSHAAHTYKRPFSISAQMSLLLADKALPLGADVVPHDGPVLQHDAAPGLVQHQLGAVVCHEVAPSDRKKTRLCLTYSMVHNRL